VTEEGFGLRPSDWTSGPAQNACRQADVFGSPAVP
jgi:hypothetical protein